MLSHQSNNKELVDLAGHLHLRQLLKDRMLFKQEKKLRSQSNSFLTAHMEKGIGATNVKEDIRQKFSDLLNRALWH
jgi:hypothetical protein